MASPTSSKQKPLESGSEPRTPALFVFASLPTGRSPGLETASWWEGFMASQELGGKTFDPGVPRAAKLGRGSNLGGNSVQFRLEQNQG